MAEVTDETRLTVVKLLAGGRDAEFVATVTKLKPRQVIEVAHPYGYPQVSSMQRAAEVLQRNLDRQQPTTRSSAPPARSASSTTGRAPVAGSSAHRGEDPSPGRETRPGPGEGPQLKAGARRILDTLARHHPMRVTRAQLGALAKFKITGGTFGTYWSTLKRHGLVDEDGGDVGITDAGIDFLGARGDLPAGPLSTDELLAQWRSVLKAGARLMLDTLIDRYPDALTRDDLAAAVDMAPTGGTFGTYLGTLRRNGLVEVDADGVRAADVLFLGAAP